MYQKIPTVSPRIHPMVAGAAIAALCIVTTIAIVAWLPASHAAPDDDPVSAPVPATANAAQVPPQFSAQPRMAPAAAAASAPRAART